jgi:hypothetical protein
MGRLSFRHAEAIAARQNYHDSLQPDPFCPKCGAPTLTTCEHCKQVMKAGPRPAYCTKCGKPFPWTEIAIQAAEEYTDELEKLSAEEKAILKETFTDLTVDTPRTELAANRFKKFLGKIGPVAGDALTKIIVNVATEAAKKRIGI